MEKRLYSSFLPLSGDVLVCSVPPCLIEWERLVAERSLRKWGGQRCIKREKLCSTEILRNGYSNAHKSTSPSGCIFITLQWCGFSKSWKGRVERGNALSQCHVYMAFQTAIAREQLCPFPSQLYTASTLQSQGWSTIFSDTVPPGAFSCPGLLWRKVHTLYQWQPWALNLGQRRDSTGEHLGLLNLPLVFIFFMPCEEGVKFLEKNWTVCGSCVECGMEWICTATDSIRSISACSGLFFSAEKYNPATYSAYFQLI